MSSRDTAILQMVVTRGVGPRTIDRVLKRAADEGEEFVGPGAGRAETWARLGLKPALAEAVAVAREQAGQLRDAMEADGVFLLVKGSPGYPERLTRYAGDTAAPVLFARGNRAILERPAVAFCGSRKASAQGLDWARKFASGLAAEGVNVVSGYADGIDLIAHRAALEAGGRTTLVLAEGIFRFTRKPVIDEVLDEHRSLILSEFPPRLPWSVGNAMQRNGTVLGLSDAIVVVESGLDGGTFSAGDQALKQGRPLFVLDYPEPPASAEGNRAFLRPGARPLRSEGDGTHDLAELLRLVRDNDGMTRCHETLRRHQGVQRSLFDAGGEAG